MLFGEGRSREDRGAFVFLSAGPQALSGLVAMPIAEEGEWAAIVNDVKYADRAFGRGLDDRVGRLDHRRDLILRHRQAPVGLEVVALVANQHQSGVVASRLGRRAFASGQHQEGSNCHRHRDYGANTDHLIQHLLRIHLHVVNRKFRLNPYHIACGID